ncbi:hypothetical protein [Pseudonocardia acaciae]|uniref:hypothetical protein n=1 Tax=Pseudonocardia acaciae TaxID=551276 RepID=UPI00048E2A0E|nr:hypothetical protein [Pseudonocardia acaciae]
MQSAFGSPMTRFVLAAVAAAVVVADGIVLVGFTSAVPGTAMPVHAPALAPAPSSIAPSSAAAPTPSQAAPPPAGQSGQSGKSSSRSSESGAGNTSGQQGVQPKIKSPFAERCRGGQIPSWLCQGIPGG